MSVSGNRGIGIPIILLHDAEGAIITIEIKGGTSYRGFLDEAQDNMNCTLKVIYCVIDYILYNINFIYLHFLIYKECIKTDSKGKETRVEIAYVRGSQITFIVLPNMLQKAPFFNRIKMYRKYKGHAIFGTGGMIDAPVGGGRGSSLVSRGGRGGRGDAGGRGGFVGGPPFQGNPYLAAGAPPIGLSQGFQPRGPPMGMYGPQMGQHPPQQFAPRPTFAPPGGMPGYR